MNLHIFPNKYEMGEAAGRYAAEQINRAIAARGQANIILATGASQFEMLGALVAQAVDDPCHKTNVVPVTVNDFRNLYLEVL